MNQNARDTSISALLLAPREDLAAVDRRALREAGFRAVRILSSGVDAARLLAGQDSGAANNTPFVPSLVLCNEQLADMSGDDFVRLVRLHPNLLDFPVIVAASADTPETRRLAVESGYSGLLIRPYPQIRLLEEVERAHKCRDAMRRIVQDKARGDGSAFDEALIRYEEAAQAQARNSNRQFREGLVLVRQQQWDAAISLLQKALEENPGHADALLALGAAWRGKGNETKYKVMLREAVAVFVEQTAWEKASAVSRRIRRDYPDLPNPLLEEAGRLLIRNNFEDAAQAVLSGRDMSSEAELYDQLYRACTLCIDTPKAMLALQKALTAAGEDNFASQMRLQFLNRLQSVAPESVKNISKQWDSALPDPLMDPLPTPLTTSSASSAFDAPLLLSAAPSDASSDVSSGASARGEKHPKKKRKRKDKNAIELIEPDNSLFEHAKPSLRDVWTVAKVTLGLFRRLK